MLSTKVPLLKDATVFRFRMSEMHQISSRAPDRQRVLPPLHLQHIATPSLDVQKIKRPYAPFTHRRKSQARRCRQDLGDPRPYQLHGPRLPTFRQAFEVQGFGQGVAMMQIATPWLTQTIRNPLGRQSSHGSCSVAIRHVAMCCWCRLLWSTVHRTQVRQVSTSPCTHAHTCAHLGNKDAGSLTDRFHHVSSPGHRNSRGGIFASSKSHRTCLIAAPRSGAQAAS